MSKNLVIIPTYNEIENIENMVRKVFSLPKEFDLLIVDDCRMSSEQRLTFICRDKFTPAWCFNQASFAKINLRPMEAVVDDALRPAFQKLLTLLSSQSKFIRYAVANARHADFLHRSSL